MNIAHRVMDNCRAIYSSLTPVPTQSQFDSKGLLMPSEFIDAGDLLVSKFPTWQWQSTDAQHQVWWLPQSKQYLISRGLHCRRRVRDLEESLSQNVREDDGWTIHESDTPDICEEEISEISFNSSPSKHAIGYRTTENFITANPEEIDPAVATVEPCSTEYFVRPPPGADILQTRTYSLTITYDKYYQVPRLWFSGSDENGTPLKNSQIFEDILSQYANTTVTVESHPCTGLPTASIHPCNHANMMKKVVDSWKTKGVAPRHDLTLFVLLKFISSVVPTIDYDFTADIDMI